MSSKVVSYVRLFSTSMVFAAWAVVRLLGFHSDLVSGMFLMLVAVTLVVSECERHRIRKEMLDR